MSPTVLGHQFSLHKVVKLDPVNSCFSLRVRVKPMKAKIIRDSQACIKYVPVCLQQLGLTPENQWYIFIGLYQPQKFRHERH